LILDFEVKNFKSIRDSRKIEFKPLTIFTGPNSSGKSNLLEALAILAQTTRLSPGVNRTLKNSLHQGESFKYPANAIDFIAHKKESNRWISFNLRFKLQDFDKKYLDTVSGSILYRYSFRPDLDIVSQSIRLGRRRVYQITHRRAAREVTNKFLYPYHMKDYDVSKSPADEILKTQFFDEPRLPPEKSLLPNFRHTLELARKSTQVFADKLSRVYLISAARGLLSPEVRVKERRDTYPPSWVGTNGQHVIEVLSLIFGREENTDKANKIVEWSERFGIGKVKAGWLGGQFLGSDFKDPIFGTLLSTAVASHGSRQLLTIITQMFWSNSGDVIMVEEPEISLHPKSQILVQELFAEVINEGKQIICTTHSPFFVLALSRIIKSGAISRDEVAVYHVKKTDKGTEIQPLKLNERGFIVGWIPTYVEVENELFREWAEGLD